MTMPKFDEMLSPFLESIKDGEPHKYREIANSVATTMKLTPEDMQETLASGKLLYLNRVGWASTYLKKAGLIEATSRAVFRITPAGIEALKECQNGVTLDYLKKYRYFSTTSCRGVPERRFRSDIRHTHDKCR